MSLSLCLYVCLFAVIKTRSSNKQQQNNTTTINFFPEKGFKNLEDTAKKHLRNTEMT